MFVRLPTLPPRSWSCHEVPWNAPAEGRSRRGREALLRHGGAGPVPFRPTCSPRKRIMSGDPGKAGQADWDRFDWDVVRQELAETAELARTLRIWAVLGSVHPLTPPHRPHNSLYVISDRGEVMTRYDERMLSNTKITYMYSPGSAPITFEVDGMRFGCALGIECHFPEIFLEYERLDVDAERHTACTSPQARSHARRHHGSPVPSQSPVP